MRFTTKGGSQFPMLVPIVGLSDEVNKEQEILTVVCDQDYLALMS